MTTQNRLLSSTIVMEGESVERFELLFARLQSELQPANAIELCLVENMAVARWRQMRLWAIEKARIQHQLKEDRENSVHDGLGSDVSNLDAPTQTALAVESLGENSSLLTLIGRTEGRYERQFHRALTQLTRLRKQKK